MVLKPTIESKIISSHDIDPFAENRSLRYNLWASDNKVALTWSYKLTGNNKNSGKRYVRWSTEGSMGYYRRKDGVVIPFNYQRPVTARMEPRRKFKNIPFDGRLPIYARTLEDDFNAAVKKAFGIEGPMDLYPIAKHWGVNRVGSLYPALRRAERLDDMSEFVARVFGKTNVRKDMVKAVANADQWSVHYASAFRGLVPVDWMVNFLRNHPKENFLINDYGQPNKGNLRGVLKVIEPRSLRRLLNETLDGNAALELFNITNRADAVYLRMEEDKVYRNIHELHELLTNQNYTYTLTSPFVDKEVIQTVLADKVKGEVGGMVIDTARHSSEMTEWGNYMHNCIGSYRSTAISGSRVYGKVTKDDELIANFEISDDGRMIQLLAKYNGTMPDDVADILEPYFIGKGIDMTSYWGKPRRVLERGEIIFNRGEGIDANQWREIGYVAQPVQLADVDW